MNALHYKGFQGAVEFEDGRLVIQILHIDDLITVEFDSAAEAQSEFERLVDDYLATCQELGKEPCKPFKGSFNVRVSPELHRQTAMAAADEGMSLNAWVSDALQAYVDRRKSRKAILDRGLVRGVISQPPIASVYAAVETVQVQEFRNEELVGARAWRVSRAN
jgi:predicted HicB family RNase H-like nuclease